MEYNKNRFQKTNDKKILHKVKKQWVVLSVALLAALGGGATVATTHASANADGANGQNNDQETTVKNRINQNLKLAQNQSANNNASQGQTKQVNVNSLSSDQITKQANLLHNQMLLGAAQGTNTKTANGRQAARQNAETNRINANTSAVASAANQKPAANANHSRMFGAAAPSANFGGMRKPEMRLGSSMRLGGTETGAKDAAKSLINPSDVKKAFVDHVRVNSNADTQGYANYAYDDLLSMASLANVKSVANSGMKVGSDSPSNSGDNWIGQLNRAKNDLDTINKNHSGASNNRFSSADAQVDSLANRLYNSSINSNVSVSKTLTRNDIDNVLNNVNTTQMTQDEVNSTISSIASTMHVTVPTNLLTISDATITGHNANNVNVNGTTNVNSTISNLIDNGETVLVNVNSDLKGLTLNVQAKAKISQDNYNSIGSEKISLLKEYLISNNIIGRDSDIKPNVPFNVTHTISNPHVDTTVPYTIHPLASDAFNAHDIATMLDGNADSKDRNSGLDNIAGKVIAGKANPAKRSNIANNIRDAINTINNEKAAGEYQKAVSDAGKLSTDIHNSGGNETTEQSALNDMSTQLEGTRNKQGSLTYAGVADYLSASNASSSVVATVRSLGNLANQWAGSMSTDTSEINSASASASTDSGDVNNAAANSFVKSDSAASATVSKDVSAENSASNVIAIASSAYSSNADLNSSAAADASTAAVSASSASSEASKEVVNAESSAIASASSAVNSELSSANSASTKASASNVGDSNTSLTNSLSNDIKSLTSASGSIHAQSSANSADANNDSNSASTASTAAKSANNAVSSINSSASSNSTAIANDKNTATTASQTANNQKQSSNVANDTSKSGNSTVAQLASNYANDIANKSKAISNFAANSNSAQNHNDTNLINAINTDSSALNSLVSDANSSKATADSSSIAKESSNASSASGSTNVKADSSIASQFSTDQSIINSASGVTAAHSAGDLSADDKASSEASMANDNLNSLVNEANASASEAQNLQNELNQTPENYTVPIHIVYEDANGSEEQRYDQSDNQYISNSDTEYVMVTGSGANRPGNVNTYVKTVSGIRSLASTATAVGNGAELYNNDASDTRHALGDDSSYSLASISDVNGNTQSSNNSLGVSLTSNGNWTWLDNSGSALNQSVPTFYYKANANAGSDINVQYINQNGYKVNAVASASNMNGAAELTTGSVHANERSVANSSYSGDINYQGSGQYGNTIDVLAGLSSVASASVSVPMTISNGSINYSSMAERLPVTSDGSGSIYSTTYSFGFKPKAVSQNGSMSYVNDSTPSYSDYAFESSEQTVTLPIHGQNIPSNYPTVTLQLAIRNHKGSVVSSGVSTGVTMSDLARKAGINGPVHYGDLIKVDPQSFASSGDDVASSDYNVDPYNTSSDNTGQNVPEIYVSENGPQWISIDNREDATPTSIEDATSNKYWHNAYTHVNAQGSTSDVSASDHTYTTARGTDSNVFTDQTNTPNNTITFNYIHGQHEGTTMPIHVTYRDQNNNVVQEGMIKPTGSDYGDMINIPSGANITNTSATSMFGSGATLPSGYILDTTKDGTGAENYIVNSDWNATSYSDYTPGTNKWTSDKNFSDNNNQDNIARNADGTAKFDGNTYAGNNITLYVRGQYHTTSNGKLLAHVHFVDSDNKPVTKVNLNGATRKGNNDYEIPLYLNNFNGDSEIISPSDFEPQAQNAVNPSDSNNKSKIYDVTPSDLRYKVTFNGNGTITTQALSDNGQNPKGAPVTSKINGNMIEPNSDVSFTYRAPTNKVAQHTVNVHYFYSDLSDVPDGNTPISKNHVIPLNNTTITENVQGSDFNLNPYMANPPKGYQFVRVMNDSDTTAALKNHSDTTINDLHPITRSATKGNVTNNANNVALSSNGTDNIDIKLVPTSRGITFHYYDQNGNPVHPDSDNLISDSKGVNSKGSDVKYHETDGQDFTNSDSYVYSDEKPTANNVHTEFGNIQTQYNADGGRYYSRYGQLFNVSDIPVPAGYHISHQIPQGQHRYYRFTRNHQDVDVMVVGNQDDVSNDPKHATNPTVTSGDTDNHSTPATKTVYYNPKTGQSTTSDMSGQPGWNEETNGKTHQDADTIWVTIHEMDPQNKQIRSYVVPSYITGDTGDQFHIYASDFTPEAVLSDNGTFMYNFKPEANNQVSDTGSHTSSDKAKGRNYIRADGMINPDGTVNTGNQTTNGNYYNHDNHVDFYYQIQNHGDMKPINVTYMDGSKAVGYKQITPNSQNYSGQTISDTITYSNGDNKGDTPSDQTKIPSGYVQVDPKATYPTTIDTNHDQDIIIPVRKDSTVTGSTSYVVINHFYSGVDGGMNSLVATSASSYSIKNEYSGQQNFVPVSANVSYASNNYSAGSEDSTTDVINNINYSANGSEIDNATPNIINFNYYSSATSMNPSKAGSQSTKAASTAQPIYVQYFTGGSAVSLAPDQSIPSGDYLLGSDTELTGVSGEDYTNVTNNVPVPAGYHLDKSDQNVNYTIGNHPYQVDLHVTRDHDKDGQFPLTIIVQDQSGKQISRRTQDVYVPKNGNKTITASDYNPNSKYLNTVSGDYIPDGTTNPTSSTNFTVTNQYGKLNYQSGTLVYKMNPNDSNPSDLGPITVQYIDNDTGSDVPALNSNITINNDKDYQIKGNYLNQNISNVTKDSNGNSTIPTGYELVNKNENVDYHIQHNGQNVVVLLTRDSSNPSVKDAKVQVNVVEIDKNAGTYTYLPGVKTENISNNTTFDPHNYIPMSDYTTVNSSNKYGPNSTAYYVDPADHNQLIKPIANDTQSITYFYDKGHQHNYSGAIVLNYYDQNGKHVGYTDYINGKGTVNGQNFDRYGQKINVQNSDLTDGNNNNSVGENTPKGYLLDSDQNVNYTFNNDTQYVNLYVHGKTEQYPLTVRIHEENGDQPSDVFSHTYEINEPAGNNIPLDPRTYTPAGYQVEPSDNHVQNVKVNSDGLTPNAVDFYYNKDNNLFTKPYIVRYVNQNGKRVGYSDVVSNPDIIKKSDVDLTKPSDGGEAVPAGYTLDTTTYRNQPVHDYRFGNDHIITLKVSGNQATVPMKIYMVEKSPDGRNSDATHVYTTTEEISGQIGSSDHFLNADQYWNDLPNKDKYTVDPGNNAKQVTIEEGANGPYLSIHEWNNGQQVPTSMTDNQAVFYYDPATNEKPAPIFVHYLDENTGQEISSGEINPSDNMQSLSGGKSREIDSIGTQISDVTRLSDVTPGNPNSKNEGNLGVKIPDGYTKDSVANVPLSTYKATFMGHDQNVYIPLKPQPYTDPLTINTFIKNTQGSVIGSSTETQNISAPANSIQTYSPYDYIPQGHGDLYATASDNDQKIQIEPNKPHVINWNYTASTNASQMQIGTINVHYVTKGQNNGQNIQIMASNDKGTGYYQVDQESDHGLSDVPFYLADYLNDIPSYRGNYYHLDNSVRDAVIGYNNIHGANTQGNDDNPITYSHPVAQQGKPTPYYFRIGGAHLIFGDPTYAPTETVDGHTEAQNTQDIYVLVAPNTDKPNGFDAKTGNNSAPNNETPDNEGNGDTGNGNHFNLWNNATLD